MSRLSYKNNSEMSWVQQQIAVSPNLNINRLMISVQYFVGILIHSFIIILSSSYSKLRQISENIPICVDTKNASVPATRVVSRIPGRKRLKRYLALCSFYKVDIGNADLLSTKKQVKQF